ncbi:MAG: hypothetical protein ABI891_14320 [Acidobacteriota bacterium]
MRYVLIDKITELETGKNLKGIKNATFSDALARGGGAFLPAAFVLETMAQAAGLLVMTTIECRAQPILSKIQQMKISGQAKAGERIQVSADLCNLSDAGAKIFVEAHSDGAMKAEAEIFLALIAFEKLSETNAFEHRQILHYRLADLFPKWFAKTEKQKAAI